MDGNILRVTCHPYRHVAIIKLPDNSHLTLLWFSYCCCSLEAIAESSSSFHPQHTSSSDGIIATPALNSFNLKRHFLFKYNFPVLWKGEWFITLLFYFFFFHFLYLLCVGGGGGGGLFIYSFVHSHFPISFWGWMVSVMLYLHLWGSVFLRGCLRRLNSSKEWPREEVDWNWFNRRKGF